MGIRGFVLLTAAFALCACAAAPQRAPQAARAQPAAAPKPDKPLKRVAFHEEEYAPYAAAGNGTLEGKAWLETPSGRIGAVAGTVVVLSPVTSYSRQWYEQQYVGGRELGPRDARVDRYVRKQRADASGSFRFTRLPPGDYYVVAPITWDQISHGRTVRRREVLAQAVSVGTTPASVELTR